MKKNIVCSFLLLGVFLISFASAIQIYPQSQNITLTIPFSELENYSSTNTYNISVFYPNGSILIDNQETIKKISYLIYNLSEYQTGITGEHEVYIYGNETYDDTSYFITTNGKPLPFGSVIILFSILFIIIICGMLSLIFYTIFRFIELDFDARDLIINVSTYFGVFAVYILEKEYLGNKFIEDFMLFLISVGAITTMLLPFIAFVVCYIKNKSENREDKY